MPNPVNRFGPLTPYYSSKIGRASKRSVAPYRVETGPGYNVEREKRATRNRNYSVALLLFTTWPDLTTQKVLQKSQNLSEEDETRPVFSRPPEVYLSVSSRPFLAG